MYTDQILVVATIAVGGLLLGRVLARKLMSGIPLHGHCGACRFYDQGACKRYPPARVYVAGPAPDSPPASDVTVWPVVRVDNWCGDFERKS